MRHTRKQNVLQLLCMPTRLHVSQQFVIFLTTLLILFNTADYWSTLYWKLTLLTFERHIFNCSFCRHAFVHSDTKNCGLFVPVKIHLLHPPRLNLNGVFGKPDVLFWNDTCYVADKFEASKWEKAKEFATGVKEPTNNNELQGNGFRWKQSVLTHRIKCYWWWITSHFL